MLNCQPRHSGVETGVQTVQWPEPQGPRTPGPQMGPQKNFGKKIIDAIYVSRHLHTI